MAGATTLLAASNNSNPSTTVTGTTAAATSAGDKIVVALLIRNGNPTGVTCTFDGIAMTELVSARSFRGNNVVCLFYYDDTVGRVSGKTITAAWTNTGTTDGGGSLLAASKFTPTNAFVAGAPELVHTGNGLSLAPSTGASGTPSDTAANYAFFAVLGVLGVSVAGQASPDNAYTAITEASNTTRTIMLESAWKEFTSPPVASQTETWTQTWGGTKAWSSYIVGFKETVPGAPANTVAPAVTGTQTVGSTLTSDTGSWTNSPTSYAYQWQIDPGTSGATWLDLVGATASTYVIPNDSIGSKLRCRVTATNAFGNSAPVASNVSGTIPQPANITWRIIGGPLAQSDNQTHNIPLSRPLVAGDRILLMASCSNANIIDGNGNKSDIGSVTDDGGHTWIMDAEAFNDPSINQSAQIFRTDYISGLAYNSNITEHVWGGTGAGAYHGQSPFTIILAINSGIGGTTLALDGSNHGVDILTSHAAPSITMAAPNGIVIGFHNASPPPGGGWWTPVAGFTEICDTDLASNLGGESAYAISGEAKITSAGYTGGAGGTTASNKTVTNLVVAYSYSGTTSVSKTLSASYNVKNSISKNLSPAYNIRVTATKALSSSYNVQVSTAKSLSASYKVRVFATKTLAASYFVSGGIQKSLTASYNVRARISKTLTSSYIIRKSATRSLAATYVLQGGPGKSLNVNYSVRNTTTKSLTANYLVGLVVANVPGQMQIEIIKPYLHVEVVF